MHGITPAPGLLFWGAAEPGGAGVPLPLRLPPLRSLLLLICMQAVMMLSSRCSNVHS